MPEICDEIDNDCDGAIDDEDDNLDYTSAHTWWLDNDGDRFGDPEHPVEACDKPDNTASNDQDCDDERDDINPDADETCDGLDNDCDGQTDRDDLDVLLSESDAICFPDVDQDTYGANDSDGFLACECLDGEAERDGDCDEDEPLANPDADYSDEARASGSYDWNCDGLEETQDTKFPARCEPDPKGKPGCWGTSGWDANKLPMCGVTEMYQTACTLSTTTTGSTCTATMEERTQACR